MRQALIYALSRFSLALIFVHHGLVPKLLARDANDMLMLEHLGVPRAFGDHALLLAGALEVVFGALLPLESLCSSQVSENNALPCLPPKGFMIVII